MLTSNSDQRNPESPTLLEQKLALVSELHPKVTPSNFRLLGKQIYTEFSLMLQAVQTTDLIEIWILLRSFETRTPCRVIWKTQSSKNS